MPHHFMPPSKKNEIFMPPLFYVTLKILMPPFLCHPGGGIKKMGGGIKKNQWPQPRGQVPDKKKSSLHLR